MSDFTDAADLISRLYRGEVTFESATKGIQDGTMKATPALADQLWVACSLLGNEENPLYRSWTALSREVQMRQLGVTAEDVLRTTQQFGPRYNKVDSKGFLIPYSLDPSSIPSDGDGKFRGLRAKSNGEIDFFFEQAPNEPLMIFGQDIDVALIIAFHPSGQKIPTLGIEALDDQGPEQQRWSFRKKDWDPKWIGHTMLGETLYAADYWLGQIVGYTCKHFPLTEEDIPDLIKRTKAVSLLKDFELCGGQSDGHWNRVMLRPGDAHGTWNKTSNGDIICDLHHVEVGVDGANVKIEIDPETNKIKEDRSANLNDPRFAMGRAAIIFTQRYDEIAEMFPMYERGRQLVGLLKTVVALKERYKFTPSKALAEKIDRAYQLYSNRPPLTLRQRLCLQYNPEG
ncbi:MAG: hypothetical protein WAO98_07975 [Alphaproteobacteria bacterium]